MSDRGRLPGWLKPANRVIVALQRLGLAIGTMRLLSVPGRKSGKLRTTPVSPLTVDGRRYIIAGLDQADWVKNARAAGWGILARGRRAERVTLVELPPEERGPILRAFPRLVPHGVQFFQQVHGVTNDPEAFAALAPRCPVFRVDPMPAADQRLARLITVRRNLAHGWSRIVGAYRDTPLRGLRNRFANRNEDRPTSGTFRGGRASR